MLNIRDLRIDPASLGTKKLLVDVAPAYEYKDGKRLQLMPLCEGLSIRYRIEWSSDG